MNPSFLKSPSKITVGRIGASNFCFFPRGRSLDVSFEHPTSSVIRSYRPRNASMLTLARWIVFAVVICGVLSDTVGSSSSDARRLKKKLSIANNNFAMNLMRLLPKDKNIVISPFCLSSALGMLYAGAGPSTARKMASALQYVSTNLQEEDVSKGFEYLIEEIKQPDPGFTMVGGEAVFFEANDVRPEFRSAIESRFKGHAESVNFTAEPTEAKDAINIWVRNSTKGLVSSFLRRPIVQNNTKLVSLSVVYFRGFWDQAFNPNDTYEGEFLNGGTQLKKISMMRGQIERAGFAKLARLNSTLLDLAYGDNISMVLILPDNPTNFSYVESQISPVDIQMAKRGLTPTSVDVHLPKFEIEASYNLQDALLKSGMVEAFSELDSDFSNISETDGHQLSISKVLHKVKFRIEEDGLSVTSLGGIAKDMLYKSQDDIPDQKVFRAEHPFLFYVFHNPTNVILFSGRMVKF
ncbi:serpin B6 [Galendromus occidentalis]|uniref:Serpin B6 n=1 Tax=Galendromus occidentalis TaxID=34638 RepID=A0AAJ6VZ64_9ACAR|nr:serpin B6 [Galendromus occidentalis]